MFGTSGVADPLRRVPDGSASASTSGAPLRQPSVPAGSSPSTCLPSPIALIDEAPSPRRALDQLRPRRRTRARECRGGNACRPAEHPAASRQGRRLGPGRRPASSVSMTSPFAGRRPSARSSSAWNVDAPVDLCADREAATLALGCASIPASRSSAATRASAYARAARAAPDAVQVADALALAGDLRDVLERSLHRRSVGVRGVLRAPPPDDAPEGRRRRRRGRCRPTPLASEQRLALVTRRVRRLHADGMSLHAGIADPRPGYQTVELTRRSDTCPDWQPGRRRPSLLDQHEGLPAPGGSRPVAGTLRRSTGTCRAGDAVAARRSSRATSGG